METGDAQLVRRTLAGDLDGFGELHRRYYERVVMTVAGILKDRERAEDAVQEAYLSALDALPRLTDGDRFYPWLRRIAVNRAIELKRSAGRKARLHDAWTDREEASRPAATRPVTEPPLDRLVASEKEQAVRRALERLPEGQRAAVVLRYFDELPMREISEVLGCEEVTARTQVFRGLKKLGEMLGRDPAAPDATNEDDV